MRRWSVWMVVWALFVASPLPLAAQSESDEDAIVGLGRQWLDLYQSHRRSELCRLLTDDFTTRSDWGRRTGRPTDKTTFCASPGATSANSTFLVFDLGGFQVERTSGTSASLRFQQYFCQERSDFSYSSVGNVALTLRKQGGRWLIAGEVYSGERRTKREGCLEVPAPTRPACRDHVCPYDSVLFPRLQDKVCRGGQVTQDEYVLLTPHDVRLLWKTYSALYGYTFRDERMRDFFYGPGAASRHPGSCRFTMNPAFDHTVKRSPLTPDHFRRMVELRDFFKRVREGGEIPGEGDGRWRR